MKKSVISFVKNSNNFFFFFGFISLLLFVSYQIYDANFSNKRNYNSIDIVQSNDDIPVEYKKRFIEKIEDTYIFRISSNRLVKDDPPKAAIVENFNMFSGGSGYHDFETVNFLFAKTASEPTLLLEQHTLVLNYRLLDLNPNIERYRENFKTDKHLFSVVLEDNNQDNVLNSEDNVHLLASDYNGKNLITIASNITDYEVVDHNLLLISVKGDKSVRRLIYNLASNTSDELNTELPN